MQPDIPAIVTAHTRDDIRTHWDGCELDHPVCAILQLAGEVGRAKAETRRLEQAITTHRHNIRFGRRRRDDETLWQEVGADDA